jgi:type II secretion system protein H
MIEMTRRGGFTLIELMVVVAIVGILASLTVGAFQGTRDEAELHAAARELVSRLHLAWSDAVSRGQQSRLRFAMEEGRYWIELRSADDGKWRPADDAPGGAESRLPRRVKLELRRGAGEIMAPPSQRPARAGAGNGPAAELRFASDGTTEACEIQLRDAQGHGIAIRVDGATGRTDIRPLEREMPMGEPGAAERSPGVADGGAR